MKYEAITSIRYKDGFTSSTYLYDHILTSSATGIIHRWDLDSGNLISQFHCNPGLKYCIPYSIDYRNYTQLILQDQDSISLYDLNQNIFYSLAKINTRCFARIDLLSIPSSNHPFIISPFDLNAVKIFDLRLNNGRFSCNEGIEIPPFRISHPQKSEVGMIHSCVPFYSFGEFCIACTYESGSIAIYDIRKPNLPAIPVYIMDSLEPIPALSIWNNLLLIGDAVGNIWMLYSSKDKGIVPLKSANVAKDSSKPPGITCLATSTDGSFLVAGCWDRSVRILETKTLDLKHILNNHCSSIVDVSFSKDFNKFCTCSSDGNANIWDLFSS